MTKSNNNLFSIEDFDKRFIQLTGSSKTYEEAYDKLEVQFESLYGQRRYKNYESYRKSRTRRMATKQWRKKITVQELRSKLSSLPGDMEVYLDERLTEFKYGLVNGVSVKMIDFSEDPGGEAMASDVVLVISED